MEVLQKKQVEMHKNFFDKCKGAMENGYYLEAIFLEYAAIESRLEVILGVLGLPCNKDIDRKTRTKIYISNRIECLEKYVRDDPLFEKTKFDKDFFNDLNSWITDRNKFVHGLYKNAREYETRKKLCKTIAEDGYEFAKVFYSEAQKLRRRLKSKPELFFENRYKCCSKRCKLYTKD